MFCEYLRKQKQVTHEVRFKSELADVQDFPYILSSTVPIFSAKIRGQLLTSTNGGGRPRTGAG